MNEFCKALFSLLSIFFAITSAFTGCGTRQFMQSHVAALDSSEILEEKQQLIATVKPPLPIPDNPLETLKSTHPRIHITSYDDFKSIKERIDRDPDLSVWYVQYIKANADKIISQPHVMNLSKKTTGSGVDHVLDKARDAVSRIYTLGLVYRIEKLKGNPMCDSYMRYAIDELMNIVSFPDWDPPHFLDTGEFTHAAAIGYDWFYDCMNDTQRSKVVDAIRIKGLDEIQKIYKEKQKWSVKESNWNFVCNSGCSIGALAIGDLPQHRDIASEVIRSGIESLNNALPGFLPDGAWDEGVGYWYYGTRYLTYYISGLKSALGTDFNLPASEALSETCDFPIYLSGTVNSSFNFGDASSEMGGGEQLSWFAKRFNKPQYMWWYRTYINTALKVAALEGKKPAIKPEPYDLLWYDSTYLKSPVEAGYPLDRYFSRSEVVTFRSSWVDKEGNYDTNALFVGLKGRNVPELYHADLDHGDFYLEAKGVIWAAEMGKDEYALKNYSDHNSRRWEYYRKRTEGQNTLLINPALKPGKVPYNAGQKIDAKTRVINFQSSEGEAFAVMDLTDAYSVYDATNVKRGVTLFDHRSKVLLQDEIEQKQINGELWWFMHTMTEFNPTIDPLDSKRVILTKVDSSGKPVAKMVARILAPQNAKFSIMEAERLPSSPTPAPQKVSENSRKDYKKLAIHIQNLDNSKITIAVLFEPLLPDEHETSSLPEVKPLENWEK